MWLLWQLHVALHSSSTSRVSAAPVYISPPLSVTSEQRLCREGTRHLLLIHGFLVTVYQAEVSTEACGSSCVLVLEHVFFPLLLAMLSLHRLCPGAADVMAVVPQSAALLYVVMERARLGRNMRRVQAVPTAIIKTALSPLHCHLCAQQQHSILITQRLLCVIHQ